MYQMDNLWGWIHRKKELKDLQGKVDKALELLKADNPDIQRVIRILEGKEKESKDDKA